MRRWLARISICLLLGAVATIGVAWGYAAFIGPLTDSAVLESTEIEQGVFRTISTTTRFGITRRDRITAPIRFSKDRMILVAEPPVQYSATLAPGMPGLANREERVGWPFRAVQCSFPGSAHIVGSGGALTITPLPIEIKNGIQLESPGPTGELRALPLRPIFPGFLIDTFFYSAIFLGTHIAFGATKRALRTRRGLCPMCAYDLRGGAIGPAGSRASPRGCPECGWNRTDDQPPGEAGG